MSAFIVNKSHINAMLLAALFNKYESLTWYHKGERRQLTQDNIEATGQMLLDENIKSVSYRYSDSPVTDLPGKIDADYLIPFKFKYLEHIPSPLETIKITECYEYQSCEHPDWETSEARAFCQALIDIKITALPGYDKAPSEWDDARYDKTEGLIRLI